MRTIKERTISRRRWNSIGGFVLPSMVVLLGGCTGPSSSAPGATASTAGKEISVPITGAGSTFVMPAMSKWTYAYSQANPNAAVNYQSVGSGAGIAQYKAGTVDFGATDAPLSDKEQAEMPIPTLHIPVTAGCEVLAYNLAGINNGLKLSGDVIADIYLHKISLWNDPRIAQQNVGMNLPAAPITVTHRSDGSGTTYVFTDYLSSISPEWKAGPGLGKSVNWPVGIGGKGNEGVAGLIKQTPGAIGYIELAYAVQTKLTYGPIRNKSGNYVEATIPSTTAAAEAAVSRMKQDIRVSIVNGETKDAYPIAGFTYVLVAKTPKDASKGKAVVDFIKWVLGPGQEMATQLQYAPLPKAVLDLNAAALESISSSTKSK